jgi:tetratricopeptide (TPR) repeat protein
VLIIYVIIKLLTLTPCMFSPPDLMQLATPTLLVHQSIFYRQQERFAQAIEHTTRALSLDPTCVQAWVERGLAKVESQDAFGALSDFEQAIVINPAYARAYFGRGWARGQLRDYNGEIADAKHFLRLAPHATAHYYQRLGSAYMGKGKPWLALTYYNRVLGLAPQRHADRYQRALLLYTLRQYDAALADLNRLLAARPTWVRATYLRGRVQMALGACTCALADFSQVIQNQPQWIDPYYHRAQAFLELGHPDSAEADLRFAAQAEPDNAIMFDE